MASNKNLGKYMMVLGVPVLMLGVSLPFIVFSISDAMVRNANGGGFGPDGGAAWGVIINTVLSVPVAIMIAAAGLCAVVIGFKVDDQN